MKKHGILRILWLIVRDGSSYIWFVKIRKDKPRWITYAEKILLQEGVTRKMFTKGEL